MDTMRAFLDDFEQGKDEERYLPGELPDLPFEDGQFDLALCSHLLFTYSDHLSDDFHCRSIEEMCRVATEVRIFPLLALNGRNSPHFESVCRWMTERGYHVQVEPVPYEFQRDANRMLRIWR